MNIKRVSGEEELCSGGCRGERGRESGWVSEWVRGRQRDALRDRDWKRQIDFHLQQPQFKASQQTSEARQDAARSWPGQVGCLRAGLPPGALGARHVGQSDGTRKTIMQRCAHGDKHPLPQRNIRALVILTTGREPHSRFCHLSNAGYGCQGAVYTACNLPGQESNPQPSKCKTTTLSTELQLTTACKK